MRSNVPLLVVLTTLVVGATASLQAQRGPTVHLDSGGKPCVGAGPRDAPPPPAPVLVPASCVLQRKDVRDASGQFVSGIGIYVWRDGTVTRVRVYTMVPAPGAPNRWLNELIDDSKLQRPKFLADYTIAVGESKPIVEMKSLGVDPMVLRFSS
jgi:hypothetical protein